MDVKKKRGEVRRSLSRRQGSVAVSRLRGSPAWGEGGRGDDRQRGRQHRCTTPEDESSGGGALEHRDPPPKKTTPQPAVAL